MDEGISDQSQQAFFPYRLHQHGRDAMRQMRVVKPVEIDDTANPIPRLTNGFIHETSEYL
jgi:hypothetical protein